MELAAPLLALGAGVFFGATVHVQKYALDGADALSGTFVTLAAMAALFWIGAPFVIDWSWWGTQAAFIFALCGLIFPAASQRLQIASVAAVGAAISSAMGSFAPLFAALPAVLFLGEKMGAQGFAGLGLLIGGLLLAAGGGRGAPRHWPLIALLLPLGASVARGVVQPATKLGMAEVPSPYFATLVMATVSAPILGLFLWGSRGSRPFRGTRRGYALYALNGAIIGIGILMLNLAIAMGGVTLAAPLASTAPLWTLVFGLLVFRHERLRPRHLVMSVLVFLGAVLIVTR